MSAHPTDFQGSVEDAVRAAIVATVPDAVVEVTGGGGHYTLAVASKTFQGKSMVECHRTVYGAIAHLMAGNTAPVHAVDTLRTRAL